MVEVIKTRTFEKWLQGLRDLRAQARIMVRIDRLAKGNPGDMKPVGAGVAEMRIDYGPGYRVYILKRGPVLVVLLCGGDKASQERDIEKALALAEEWKG